jgi:hypothetical protein
VNTLGREHGITAEFVTLTGTKMGEPPGYRVIVDRISHEVDYYRAFLKHAVLTGTYVINNPFWWTADDKFFNYAHRAAARRRRAEDGVLPQKSYPRRRRPHAGVAAQPRLPDRLGRPARLRRPPAILKPYSGGGWKHVYKVTDRDELIAAYDGTGAVLHDAAAVHPLRPVRALLHVRQDRHRPGPLRSARAPLLVEHSYLTPALGARIVKDAQTLNTALGYEMNTIEFASRTACRTRSTS